MVVLLHADEYTWSKEQADNEDLSQSAYIRGLIIKDRLAVEESKLSPLDVKQDRLKHAQDDAQLIVNLARHIVEREANSLKTK